MKLRVAATVTGVGLVTFGCFLIYPPLAVLTAGIALLVFGLYSEGIE